jgi:hypothetical protein
MRLNFASLLRNFVSKVELLAEEETKEWARRFHERMDAFDRNPNLKIRLDAARDDGTAARSTDTATIGLGSDGTIAGHSTDGQATVSASTTWPSVNIRLAIEDAETFDADSLRLTVNEKFVPVSAQGLIELPLEVGLAHRLIAIASGRSSCSRRM